MARDMDIDVDFRQLSKLDDDFNALPKGFRRKVENRVTRGALNIKRGWARRWDGHDFIQHLPKAITYDVTVRGDWFSAEIGPDKHRRQGALGNIIEFGSLNSAPIPGGVPALTEEDPQFVESLASLGQKAPLDRTVR